MFKKTGSTQAELFSGIGHILGQKKAGKLLCPNQPHNVFCREVTSRIDESIFSVLYCSDNGRPNASIRRLIAMMVLKEGEDWTDEQLFEECNFDMRIMLALGLNNITDEPPASSTYYQFKSQLEQYKAQTGIDLLERCFEQITLNQMDYHGVSGKRIRLDSKLIQSNISKSSRLCLLLEGLRKHVSLKMTDWTDKVKFTQKEQELLDELRQKKAHRIIYEMDLAAQAKMLRMIGYLYQKLAKHSDEQSIIKQLYDQHYEQGSTDNNQTKEKKDNDDSGQVKPKSNDQLEASSIQSIHDPQAGYRKKNGQTFHGYHTGVAETCTDGNELNLITHVSTNKANESECDFLEQHLAKTNALLGQKADPEKVEMAIADGGYDSKKNKELAPNDNESFELILTRRKGKPLKYEMRYEQENNEKKLVVKDQSTGQLCRVYKSRTNRTTVIESPNGTRRYYTDDKIQRYLDKQKERNKGGTYLGLRANMESTIHQMFCKLQRRFKLKYRGQTRSHFYVLSRAIYVNFKRIERKITQNLIVLLDFALRLLTGNQKLYWKVFP